jgi:hypothetical protein
MVEVIHEVGRLYQPIDGKPIATGYDTCEQDAVRGAEFIGAGHSELAARGVAAPESLVRNNAPSFGHKINYRGAGGVPPYSGAFCRARGHSLYCYPIISALRGVNT